MKMCTSYCVVSIPPLAHLSPENLEAVVRFAGATSALTCTRAGANPPTRAEVEPFLYAS
ncbi:MAG: Fructokinase [Chloroflexi bacterium AL-W]|nr:Fructokinase [Chloroflexi bacterium AL-N1]NOK69029.1 Fructokinase [Chloroflexi bacterium AL-N10]NOK77012.1 Fructokinase [Chloroflexi bacterium AL-N5]NOK82600.1 Fructokinase [Chloroflexi bacterium AL-W]NOK90869.1 Fructokinase [Chloroflexi bacterium AL-N15]